MIRNSIESTNLMCLTRDDSELNHLQQIEAFISAGAKLVQLRAKTTPLSDLKIQALKASELCKKYGCNLIINDDYELAKEVDADGVHLGIKDAPVEVARSFLSTSKLIGKTVHSILEAQTAVSERPDYVGLGPFRKSATKKEIQPILTEQDFREIIHILNPIPVFLIGGLTFDDFHLVDDFNIQGLALCSELFTEIKNNSVSFENLIESRRLVPSFTI